MLSMYLLDVYVYKIIFYLKFLTLTVKVGQNKNKIDNIKIITNLLTEFESYLKRYLGRNYYIASKFV